MKTFNISLGRGLDVDVLKLVDTRVGICSNSGGGKSHLMRLMVEKIAGRVPVHIIDWEGDWYTLRPTVDAVLVAKGGDLAPQVHTATKLAQRLYEKRVSAILDVSSLPRLDRLLFVASYLEALLDAPVSHRHPMLVFIDEAQRVAPELASKGGGKELLSAIQRSRSAVIALMDSGRKRAIGGVLATQRLSKVSKDAIGEANNIFIGRYAQDTDLKRVGELLGLDGEERDAPKTFTPGEFFAQGPALSKSGTVKFKSADTQTKAPKFGTVPSAAAPSKTMSKILADLATIPEEVELEAKNYKEAQAQLRKAEAEIKRLTKENQLARNGKMSAVQKGTIIHEALEAMLPKVKAEIEAAWKKRLIKLPAISKQLTAAVVEIEKLAADFSAGYASATQADDKFPLFDGSVDFVAVSSTGRTKSTRTNHSNTPRPSKPDGVPFPPASDFGRDQEVDELIADHPHKAVTPRANGHKYILPFSWGSVPGKVLTVLIQHYPEHLSLRRLASLAGVSGRSSTFRNAISKLRTTQFATDGDNKTLRATADAYHFADDVPALPSGKDLIHQWQGRLGSGVPRQIFDALLTLHGESDKTQVALIADVDGSSSTFRNAISKLRTLGLIEKGYPLKFAPHVMEALS